MRFLLSHFDPIFPWKWEILFSISLINLKVQSSIPYPFQTSCHSMTLNSNSSFYCRFYHHITTFTLSTPNSTDVSLICMWLFFRNSSFKYIKKVKGSNNDHKSQKSTEKENLTSCQKEDSRTQSDVTAGWVVDTILEAFSNTTVKFNKMMLYSTYYISSTNMILIHDHF